MKLHGRVLITYLRLRLLTSAPKSTFWCGWESVNHGAKPTQRTLFWDPRRKHGKWVSGIVQSRRFLARTKTQFVLGPPWTTVHGFKTWGYKSVETHSGMLHSSVDHYSPPTRTPWWTRPLWETRANKETVNRVLPEAPRSSQTSNEVNACAFTLCLLLLQAMWIKDDTSVEDAPGRPWAQSLWDSAIPSPLLLDRK